MQPFSQKLRLDNHCLSGISPFFLIRPAKNAFYCGNIVCDKKAQLPFMPLAVLLKYSPSNISAAIALRCFAQATRTHAAACGIIGGTGRRRRTENVLDRQDMIAN